MSIKEVNILFPFLAFPYFEPLNLEQLERVEEGLDGMHSEMKTAEKHLTGMEKWCGLCVCPWNRTSRVRDTDGTWKNPLRKDSNAGNVVNSQPKGSAVPDAARGGPYIQRINDDAREDEMEDNMQAVGSVLGNLKSMAADMGDEISRQNKQLERIDRKVIILFFLFCWFLYYFLFLLFHLG